VAVSLMLGLSGPIAAFAAGPATVNLGTAGNFAILSKAGISTTGVTKIVGNIGVSPIGSTAITGFGLVRDWSGTFSRSTLVTGKVYAANYAAPTPSMLTTAVSNMQTAYTDALSRATGVSNPGTAGEIGGLTLAPGVYTFTGAGKNVTISTNLILSGGANDVWIFQIPGTFDVGATAKPAAVVLSGGARAQNVFWAVAGATTIHPSSVVNGTILDYTNIAMQSGAVLNGRALAQTAVTLIANTVTVPTTTSVPAPTYAITTSVVGPQYGSISPSGTVSVAGGSSQTFAITPGSGDQINTLVVDGAPVATTTSYTFSDVTANHTIAVSFGPIPVSPPVTYTGTLVVNKDTIGGNGTFTFTGNNGLGAFSVTTVSGTGSKIFNNVAPGTYTITEKNIPKGWTQTDSDCSAVVVTAGGVDTCTITDTSNKLLGEIRGTKYVDRDGSGTLKGNGHHHRLAGVTIYLDMNNDGKLDPGDPSTVTNKCGEYRFLNLPAGTYVVREVEQPGWVETYPASGSYTIVLTAGKVSKNDNFGNFKLGSG